MPCAPAAGTFLVASPSLMDPNFTRSVVLICRHGLEGTYGLIINRRTERTVSDLKSDASLLDGRDDPLYLGGPVAGDTLQVLHRHGTSLPGGMAVMGDVHLGGDPAILGNILSGPSNPGEGTESTRFVLGCSGWGEGQLDSEIREGAWIVCEAEERFVFDPDPGTVWRRVLRSLGPPWATLADLPPDPSWN